MDAELEAVLATMREQVTPTADERARLDSVASTLVSRTREAIEERGVEADVMRVGSTARGTWLRGDRDVDVFVRFDPAYTREDLERDGVAIGRDVLPDGREEYAEHPYVTGSFEGYDVDLVPCFRVEDAGSIRSAVDRTPFHAAYVAERLDEETATDVRICKRFLAAVGAYGSDLETRGFSGYLTELLVLAYGSVAETLRAMAGWRPPVRLDPADHAETTWDDPLVVVDPTDPERNVAAVVTPENVARVVHYARALLEDPQVEAFRTRERTAIERTDLLAHLDRRGATPVAIRFPAPDLVPDQLYPQLRSSLTGTVEELDRRGFEPIRSTTFARDDAVLFLELAVPELPAIERHVGPPVHVEEHARAFLDRYANESVYGPFIDADRYVVERDRAYTSAAAFLESEALLEVGHGTDVRSTLASGYDVLVGDDIAELLPAFGEALRAFYEPRP